MPFEKLKVLLLQLPNPEFNLNKRWGNVPLAAGYLKAMAHKEGLSDRVEISILDKEIMDRAGDARMLGLIEEKRPDVIGFSLYLWNGRRSMYLCREIKKRLPRVKIIVGGPEVTNAADYIFQNEAVDFGCFGDGEYTFVEILKKLLAGDDNWPDVKGIFYRQAGKAVPTEFRAWLEDLNLIPSPYLMGTFDLKKYSILSYETLRGCPCRCSYCSWATVPLRYFSADRIVEELTLIINSGVETVRFIESNPLIHPDFVEIFEKIKEVNRDKKVRFAAFSSFQQFDEEKIKLLKACNFTFIEIGLQTINGQTLKTLRRPPLDKKKFVECIRLLEKYDIRYEIDTMLGLPGESLQDYQATVQFIEENDLKPFNTFPLMLMPNTDIRKQAEPFGMHYQTEPPYYIIESDTMSSEELNRARKLNISRKSDFADKTRFLFEFNGEVFRKDGFKLPAVPQPKRLPLFVNKLSVHSSELPQSGEEITALCNDIRSRLNYPFTLRIIIDEPDADFTCIQSFLKAMIHANPFIIINIMVECADPDMAETVYGLSRFLETRETLLGPKRAIPAWRMAMIVPYLEKRDLSDFNTDAFTQFKVYCSLKPDEHTDWEVLLSDLLQDDRISGVIIDTAGRLEMDQLIASFDFLSSSRNPYYYFKNIVLYFLFHVYILWKSGQQDSVLMPMAMESIVNIDFQGAIHTEFQMNNETKLQLVGLQMKMLNYLNHNM